uniref:hypothetical protein n=1 Tax=Roseivirga sp. TaxID=1964215 RepID=UPI004048AC88
TTNQGRRYFGPGHDGFAWLWPKVEQIIWHDIFEYLKSVFKQLGLVHNKRANYNSRKVKKLEHLNSKLPKRISIITIFEKGAFSIL